MSTPEASTFVFFRFEVYISESVACSVGRLLFFFSCIHADLVIYDFMPVRGAASGFGFWVSGARSLEGVWRYGENFTMVVGRFA